MEILIAMIVGVYAMLKLPEAWVFLAIIAVGIAVAAACGKNQEGKQ